MVELLAEFERSGGRAVVLHRGADVQAFASSLTVGEPGRG